MCTLVILRRPEHPWPLVLAGNRDEMRDRPWDPPSRHWPDRPEVVAGLDRRAGGSWFGLNDHGLAAVVMNREGSLGPSPGARTRGELVLEALDHAEAAEAAGALADLDPRAYRPFNLFVGDPVSAYWLRNRGSREPGRIEVFSVPSGVHMLTARELDDPNVARVRTHLPRFRRAAAPRPADGEWGEWPRLLASREDAGGRPEAAMTLDLGGGFGTVCSHLVALPRYPAFERPPVFLFAAGLPGEAPFRPVAL
ncbi:MAG: NRDE family protein [Gammaproteobacteria bacterium]|nr:NRDE family protein [Gammaproteobacteria bacterium]